jgi:taurine dioxygenase
VHLNVKNKGANIMTMSANTKHKQTISIDERPFTVRKFSAPLGAEIIDIDLAKPLKNADFSRVKRAFLDHSVIVFRNQRISPEQLVAFSRQFGRLQTHVLKEFLHNAHPEILIVSNVIENGKRIGLGDAGRYWHSDLSYKEIPSLGSLLHAQELPSEGGDTLFANMYTAYETLPADIKQRIAGKRAAHSYLKKYDHLRQQGNWRSPLSAEQVAQVPEVWQPIVTVHPETGRPALFVSEGFTTRIEGLSDKESASLLATLFLHSTQPANVYRHQWQTGDLLFWDNRATIHLAPGCPAHLRRTMYRTTVEGSRPRGIADPVAV